MESRQPTTMRRRDIQLNIRLTRELAEQVKGYCGATGISLTYLIENLLFEFLRGEKDDED